MDNDQSNTQLTENTTNAQTNTPQTPTFANQEKIVDSTNSSLKGVYVALLIIGLFAFAGTALGIFGTIQANQAMHYLEVRSLNTELDDVSDEFPDDDEEQIVFTMPTKAEDITSATITYNNDNDYVSIVRDNDTIEYYTYDENDDIENNIINKDVSDLIQYIFDNGGSSIVEESDSEAPWLIEIETEDSRGYINGTASSQSWFDTLLNMLDVNTNGYLSNK